MSTAHPIGATQRHLSRRSVLLGVGSGAWACRSSSRAPMRASSSGPVEDWGGLQVAVRGPMRKDERGGTAVVLLHGWGAAGDDLVPLAEEIARPATRFFMPAGPLPEMGGGRAWWHLQARDRPAQAWDDELPAGHQPHLQVLAARAAVQAVIRTIRNRHAPDVLVLAGFSQGAMLSLDVALAADPVVDRVAALSGVLLADSLPALRAPRSSRPSVLIAHGRQDNIVPFEGGERARDLLLKRGFHVTWRPFDGGHDIPPATVDDLRAFLFG